MKLDGILFDLDGTLTDPEAGITHSVVYALKKYGIEEKPENCRRFIGPPLGPELASVHGVDPKESVLFFREYFEKQGIFENELYVQTVPVLTALKAMGIPLYVATSKPQLYAKQVLDHFDLNQYFDEVAGASLDESLVEKADIIHGLLENKTGTFLMVGDRKHDIEGAKANGILSAGVLSGFGSEGELKEAGADFILKDLNGVLDLCKG
jgi:phosphoglycolate phosphatase